MGVPAQPRPLFTQIDQARALRKRARELALTARRTRERSRRIIEACCALHEALKRPA